MRNENARNQKILEFPSIDNFHGTGAFNLTKFPEWDSIFLDCVDRPEELVVIQIRQRRRQRKLSGHNDYFESLKPTNSVDKNKPDGATKSSTTKKAFSTANYFDSMKPVIPSLSSTKTKTSQTSDITSKKLSGTSNYLENLSSTPASAPSPSKSSNLPEKNDPKKSNKKKPTLKDEDEKRDPSVVNEAEKSEEKSKKNFSEKQNQKPIQPVAFSPGRSTSYLESLAVNPIGTSSTGDSNEVLNKKVKQSTEISKNPFLDEVCTLEFRNDKAPRSTQDK